MPVDLSDFEPLTEAKPGLDLSDFEPIDLAPPAQSAAPTVELGPQQFTEPFETVGGVEIGAFREPITQPQEIVLPDAVPTPAGLGPELAPVAGAGTVGELLKTAKEAVSTPPWQGFGVEKIPASIILPGGAAVDLLFNSLGDSKAAQVIQGLHKAGNNQIENMANFMGSPLGVAMMGIGSLGKTAQRIVSLAFAGDMASSQPELWNRFQQATTLREKTETLADAVAGLGLTLTALKHGLTKAEKTTPAEPPPLPSPTPLTDAALGETSPRTQPQLETPNASQITGATSLPQPEVRPPVGGETSLRQQGQAPETRPEVQAEVVPTKEPAPVVQTGEVQAPPQEVAPTVQPPLKEVTPSEKEVQGREGQVAEQPIAPSVQPAGETVGEAVTIPKRVRIAGADFEVVRSNQDGTLRVKSAGGEFDTMPGEKWIAIGESTVEGGLSSVDPKTVSRAEYQRLEQERITAQRKIRLLEIENEIRRTWKPKKPLPVGVSKVAAFESQSRHTPKEKRLLAKLSNARADASADILSDFEHAGRVWDALNKTTQPPVTERTSPEAKAVERPPVQPSGEALPTVEQARSQRMDAYDRWKAAKGRTKIAAKLHLDETTRILEEAEKRAAAQTAPPAAVPSAAPEAVALKVVPEYLQKAYDECRCDLRRVERFQGAVNDPLH